MNSLLQRNRRWTSDRFAIFIQNLRLSVCVVFATFFSATLYAQVYPAGFGQTRIANPINVPVAAAVAPDGRIFAVEQTGRVRVIKNNALLSTPFVTLTVDSNGERGLLGIAVDPDFMVNKYIYVYYTVPASNGNPARNRISRFNATNDTATGGETVILNLDPLSTALIHNGGALHFGKDGKLYVAIGENSNTAHSQNLDTYHGKLLRINKDGSAPSDNPFPSGSEQRRRVWALGLRNPFTFAIDQETGKIFINDVGGTMWEEINDATLPGRNFGWPNTEGRFNQASFPNFTNPVYAYAHGTGDGVGCAIVGGAFISSSNPHYPPEYRGKYVFQENCNSWFNILDISGSSAVRSPFVTSVNRHSVGLMTGIDGYMYFLGRHDQGLFRIVYNGGVQPTITNQPTNARVVVGQSASFTVAAVGTPPLTYQWQKGTQNIPGATSATFTIAQCSLTDAGQYRVIVSNSAGNTTSSVVTLTVVENELPTAEILTPTTPATYVAGTTISFSGRGTDPEDGVLPAASMTWQINFHHDTHHHDEPPRSGISSGTFTIPQEGEPSANVWYRITLRVTDSEGFSSEDFVDVQPLKSTLAFNTNPAGLQILLDGQPFSTPGSVLSVEGVIRTIGTPAEQILNGEVYVFDSWTHGGAQNQNITTPSADITYTANFRRTQRSFYRAINLNGPALVIDGNNWEASGSSPNFTLHGPTFANQNVTLVPPTDANRASMIRSSSYARPAVTIHAVPAGTYDVFVYVWEDNAPVTYSITLEGNVVQSNYNSGSAGTWRKLGPFRATINDGTIHVQCTHHEANFSGVEIWRAGGAVTTPTVTSPLVDQDATVNSPFSYAFAANTFSPSQAGNTLTYTAALESGGSLPSWLTFNASTRTFSGTPTSPAVLNIRVTATDTGGSANDVFTLNVRDATTASFYRAVNLNGSALLIDGNNWEASGSAPNFTLTGPTFANQSVTLVPSTDANRATMIRSSAYGSPTATFNAVPAGTYDVWLYVWEDNYPVTYSISVENIVVLNNYNSGSTGTWRKLGPFRTTINDGNIIVRCNGVEANFSGVEVWRAGTSVTTPTLVTPLVDQVATVNTVFSYTFPTNTFSPSQAGNTLTYTAALESGGSLPSWLTFNASTRTFSGTPTSPAVLNIRVTATDTGGSVSDVFTINITNATSASFYRAVNLNGSALLIDGNNWEASGSAPNFTLTGPTFANQSVTLVPATDANRATMIRSSAYGTPTATFNAVPSGTYDVWVYVWEDNWAVTYSISVENIVVQSNYNSGSAGTWRKLGPFRTTINDGNIIVRCNGVEANFSGVEVWTASGSSSQRVASLASPQGEEMYPQDEQSGDAVLAFYPNPFSNKATIVYTALEEGQTSITLYDMRGVKAWSTPEKYVTIGHKESIEIETSNFDYGVYVLELINGRGVKRQKVVKVKD